jgi:hypothetical protein
MMYQSTVKHPANLVMPPLAPAVYEAIYEIFVQICEHWGNLPHPEQHRSRLYAFMDNRINLHPEYQGIYQAAALTMRNLKEEMGKKAAYTFLFTDQDANQAPPETALALVRQKVSNELISFQVAQGGFKRFTGALNYPSYIAGAYIPGEPAPYCAAPEEGK